MQECSVIKRLERELHILEAYPGLSKIELIERLKEDYEIVLSTRTLERDFSALKNDFGIEINFDQAKKGYFLHGADQERVTNFLKFAGRIYLGEILQKGLKNFQDLQESLVLEDNSDFEGVRLIKPIITAIQRQRDVGFLHENYHKETQKKYQITPFQLKEYQGRWYVVGVPKGENHIKTFGLARCYEFLQRGPSKIKKKNFWHQLEKFDQIVGLNYNGAEKREYIELAVAPKQYKYLKSLPLHSSQSCEGTTRGGWVKISLHLIPNYELKMQIWKLGDQVEVLYPKKLRKDILKTLQNTLKNYEQEPEKT